MPRDNSGLSVVIITKNEEGKIEKCLESVVWADEIIIVDSYSDDHTVEIASKYTDKIFLKKWSNSFSKQKNFGISKAQKAWILVIDADECLSSSLQKGVKKIINNGIYDGYWFSRKTFLSPSRYLKYGFFYPDYQLRLFRNGLGIKYKKRVHEELRIAGNRVVYIKKDILHFPSRSKYDKLSSIKNLVVYIKLGALDFLDKKRSTGFYVLTGFFTFLNYFFGSYIRGKGYLDKRAGFIAAFNFSLGIAVAYFYAAFLNFRGSKHGYRR